MNMDIQITFEERVLDVNIDYQPYEPPVYYYSDGTGYPGCDEYFDICCIEENGKDVTKELHGDINMISELVWEILHDYDTY